jgi:hypothetical protein
VLDHVFRYIQRMVRELMYVVPLHAEDAMDEDGLTAQDIEHVVVTGKIVEQQVDRETRELKYVILGKTRTQRSVVVVMKLGATGKPVVITVYCV